MMPRCETCKWWSPEPETFIFMEQMPLPGYSHCLMASGYVPERIDNGDEADTWKVDRKAFAADGEEYKHLLMTAADFGCVLWEVRG